MMASASEPHSRPSAGTAPSLLPLARKNRSSPEVSELSCRLRRRRVAATPGLYAKLVAIAGTFFILPIVFTIAIATCVVLALVTQSRRPS